jgi:hypothetical protein
MPYFALFYEAGDDFIARRADYREEHLRLQLGIFRQTGVQLNHFCRFHQEPPARGVNEVPQHGLYPAAEPAPR